MTKVQTWELNIDVKEITNTAYFEIEATSESSKHKVKDVTAEYNKQSLVQAYNFYQLVGFVLGLKEVFPKSVFGQYLFCYFIKSRNRIKQGCIAQITALSLGTCCPPRDPSLLVSCSPVPHHVFIEGPLEGHIWNCSFLYLVDYIVPYSYCKLTIIFSIPNSTCQSSILFLVSIYILQFLIEVDKGPTVVSYIQLTTQCKLTKKE